jgi:hypothetical protein
MLRNFVPISKSWRQRLEQLRDATYIDFDFDTISHTITVTSFWASQMWDLSISNDDPKDRLEVGILSNEKPIELEELNLAGFLTVVGEDNKPSPTLFAFPARHHPISPSFSANFLAPTGLHPTLQLQISDSKPPTGPETCSLHAHLTLPRVIFADKYQLSDKLFLASKNLTAIRHITQPVDLEAPEYAMSLWGSTLLIELAPPASPSTIPSSPKSKPQPWTAEIPLHLRYLPPTPSGYSQVEIPWPVLFWACTADEGSKFTINPFDRVNLGYDGLFGPRTMFYHLSPQGQANGNASDGYSVIDVPVLKQGYADWVEMGTAAVILLGFGWIMWKLWLVWRTEGYGRYRDVKDEKKRQ